MRFFYRRHRRKGRLFLFEAQALGAEGKIHCQSGGHYRPKLIVDQFLCLKDYKRRISTPCPLDHKKSFVEMIQI
jgi:hypothetical protein